MVWFSKLIPSHVLQAIYHIFKRQYPLQEPGTRSCPFGLNAMDSMWDLAPTLLNKRNWESGHGGPLICWGEPPTPLQLVRMHSRLCAPPWCFHASGAWERSSSWPLYPWVLLSPRILNQNQNEYHFQHGVKCVRTSSISALTTGSCRSFTLQLLPCSLLKGY